MTLKDTLVPTYTQMLGALSAWLTKAADQRTDDAGTAILNARLAPDMFPLFTQVCFSCVQAQEGVFRLRQDSLPSSVAHVMQAGIQTGSGTATMAQAQAHIADTLQIIEAAAADMPDLADDTHIAHTLPNGMVFDLTAAQYVRDWAIPQLYFHVMAAYAILRAEGISLGKPDYVAHMFAYLRPGTMPAAAPAS